MFCKLIFNKRCYNGGTKHKFSPRFTERERNNKIDLKHSCIDIINPEMHRKLITIKLYIGDICEWCGKTINKDLQNK